MLLCTAFVAGGRDVVRCMNIILSYALHVKGLDAHLDEVRQQLEREYGVELESLLWLFTGGHHEASDSAFMEKVLTTLKDIAESISEDLIVVPQSTSSEA